MNSFLLPFAFKLTVNSHKEIFVNRLRVNKLIAKAVSGGNLWVVSASPPKIPIKSVIQNTPTVESLKTGFTSERRNRNEKSFIIISCTHDTNCHRQRETKGLVVTFDKPRRL